MKTREIIYPSTIIVLGFIQVLPCALIWGSTIINAVLGITYTLALVAFWRGTIIGRWFFRELWRSNLRLEKLLLGENA